MTTSYLSDQLMIKHPIIPPSELIKQWWDEANQNAKYDEPIGPRVAIQAAQWGADQELEACITNIHIIYGKGMANWLRTLRRPEPPSLKEQAYDALDTYIYGEPDPKDKERTYNTIRKALEALPND